MQVLAIILLAATTQDLPSSILLVRDVPVVSPPAGWLEREEEILEQLKAHGIEIIPASKAADNHQVLGYRFDRARLRIREALDKARIALEQGDIKRARRQLNDVEDLLAVGGVVSVMPPQLLRRFHLLKAGLPAKRGRSGIDDYVALLGVSDDSTLDLSSLQAARDKLRDVEPAGIVIEAEHSGASLFLDGVLLGTRSIRRYDISPGVHYLRVIASGKVAFGERLRLRPGDISRRTVRLEEASDSVPPKPEKLAKSATVMALRAKDDAMELQLYREAQAGPAVQMALETDADTEKLVNRTLGIEPLALESIVATSPETPEVTHTTEPTDDEEPFDKRWLWAGAGAAAAIGIVVGLVLLSGGDESRKAGVWLCPQGESCAP